MKVCKPTLSQAQADRMLAALETRVRAIAGEVLQAPAGAPVQNLPAIIAALTGVQELVENLAAAFVDAPPAERSSAGGHQPRGGPRTPPPPPSATSVLQRRK